VVTKSEGSDFFTQKEHINISLRAVSPLFYKELKKEYLLFYD